MKLLSRAREKVRVLGEVGQLRVGRGSAKVEEVSCLLDKEDFTEVSSSFPIDFDGLTPPQKDLCFSSSLTSDSLNTTCLEARSKVYPASWMSLAWELSDCT